jgi:anti-sigma factor RsiW
MLGERDDEILWRAVAAELTPAEALAVQSRLAAEPALPGRMEELRKTAAALRGARHDAFAAGFASRVARRATAELSQSPLSAALLQRYFMRLVPATVAAMLLLAGYTLRGAGPGQGGVEALLGLRPVTAEALLPPDPPGL